MMILQSETIYISVDLRTGSCEAAYLSEVLFAVHFVRSKYAVVLTELEPPPEKGLRYSNPFSQLNIQSKDSNVPSLA